MNRRNFIAFTVVAAGVGYGAGKLLPKTNSHELYLRPPGAVKNFEALCIKCGQCVQVCPYHSINLLDITQGYSNGTSYISPNDRGCYLCDLFPCVLACPSGALDHHTTRISDVLMGIAVLGDVNSCLAYKNENINQNGVLKMFERKTYNEREEALKETIKQRVDNECDLCVRLCPVGDEAIAMRRTKDGANLPDIKEKCVGCGVCAEVCLAQIISIIPNKKYNEIYKEG
ncbi:4Fe-4S dicluster domain-containing protein [Campylobacter sp. RM9328]|uniref:4Fe-4S dicluster domain-containing protein n=1 Tax=Campylobacter sp. RM9328 TaxID=1705720 RepID=UPI001475852C|nr:4Fe-4S dicluster domain-containing protein [Campylobacter sp. RM9328]